HLILSKCSQNNTMTILFYGNFQKKLPFHRFLLSLLKIEKIIATDKLHTDQLKCHFKNKAVFETQDIVAFYEQKEKNIKLTTVNWRIYTFIQKGILKRIGRGKFSLGEGKNYLPEI